MSTAAHEDLAQTSSVFVVHGQQGEYSDWRIWPVRAFTDEEEARRFAEAASAESREISERVRKGNEHLKQVRSKYDPEVTGHDLWEPIDYSIWAVPMGDRP